MEKTYIKIIPNNVLYPTINTTSEQLQKVIEKVYHDTYRIQTTSDWYENTSQTVVVNSEQELNIQLPLKKGTLTLNGMADTATVGETTYTLPKTISLPYNKDLYTIVFKKKFHEDLNISQAINPTNMDRTLEPTLVRKQGVWKTEQVRTEVIAFTTKTVVDDTKPSSYYKVNVPGVNGERTFKVEKEYIDDEFTGQTRNDHDEITKQPIQQVVTIGKEQITWESKTSTVFVSPLPATVVERDDLYFEDSYTVEGTIGEVQTTWEEKYIDGVATGERRNETEIVITPVVKNIYYKGIKTRDVITWVEQSRVEIILPETQEEYSADYYTDYSSVITNGTNGERTFTWEEKHVNGVATDEKRNEFNSITKQPQPKRILIGTKEIVSWIPKSQLLTEDLPEKTRYDSTIPAGETFVETQPQPKRTLVTWLEKHVKGVSSGERKDESETVEFAGVAKVTVIGNGVPVIKNLIKNGALIFTNNTWSGFTPNIMVKNDEAEPYETVLYSYSAETTIHIPTENLVVGKTYRLEFQFRTEKSSESTKMVVDWYGDSKRVIRMPPSFEQRHVWQKTSLRYTQSMGKTNPVVDFVIKPPDNFPSFDLKNLTLNEV